MSKYNNKKVEFDGYTFDSILECDYYKRVRYGKALHIKQIDLQPVYILQDKCKRDGKTIQPITYRADFLLTRADGRKVVVEIKGMATEAAKMKRKMFLFRYPELELNWISYSKKDGGWIDYFELQKLRRERAKLRKAKKK